MRPRLAAADIVATFVTEASPNSFPRLPVREGEPVFVWLTRWRDLAEEAAFWTSFSRSSGWRDGANERVLTALARKPERLRLAPTAGSRLR